MIGRQIAVLQQSSAGIERKGVRREDGEGGEGLHVNVDDGHASGGAKETFLDKFDMLQVSAPGTSLLSDAHLQHLGRSVLCPNNVVVAVGMV